MANKKISELESRASLSLSDLMAVGDPSTGYLYKTTISDLKTLTGAGVVSFNGRFGTVNPAEGDYTLTQLGDVIITSPSNGQVLKYNGSNWVNASDVTEADTLDTVTTRGNTTANSITVGSVTAAGLSNLLGQIRTFATTGNTYIGANPTSATDAGFKLDVNGTARIGSNPADVQLTINGRTTAVGAIFMQDYLSFTGTNKIIYTNDLTFNTNNALTNGTATRYLFTQAVPLANTGTGTVDLVKILMPVNTGAAQNVTSRGLVIDFSVTTNAGTLVAIDAMQGTVRLRDLAGTGSRMVVADSAGNLSTQAIPDLSGYVTLGTAQTITATKTFSSGIVVSNSGIVISGGTGDYLNVETGGEKTYFGTSFIRAWDKQSGGSRVINLRPSGLAAGSEYSVSFPAKSGTIAFTDDIPSVAGVYLPLAGGTLTGALNGTTATFTGNIRKMTSGASDYTELQSDGVYATATDLYLFAPSGRFVSIYAGGAEVLRIASNAAASFSSSVTANSFVKSGGTSSQFLKANGSVDSNTYLTSASVSGVYLPLAGGTLTGGLNGTTGSFAASGSGDTFTINHSSGSGIALNITKAGNGEGLYINKTSGSGNAATIIGTLNATTLVKSGGTSSQFLKADGSVDSNTYLTSASVSGVYLPLSGGTLTGTLGGTSAAFSGGATFGSGVRPITNFAADLGTSSFRWSEIFGYAINLSQNATIGGTLAVTGAATFSSSVQANSIKLNTSTSSGYFHIETSLPWGTKSNELINFTSYGYAGNINTEHNTGSINWYSGTVRSASITAWRNLPASGDLFDLAFSTNPGGSNLTERMRITSGGETILKSNSTSVVDILTLYNNQATSAGVRQRFQNGFGDLAAIKVSQRDNGALADDGIMEFQVASNSILETKMAILNNGNVGIGTAAPDRKLSVIGNIYANGGFSSYRTDGGVGLEVNGGDLGAGTYIAKFNDYSNNPQVVITGNGRLGIGTTAPNTALDVNGTINVRTNGFEFGRITTNNVTGNIGGLTFQYNASGTFTNGMLLTGGGNVEISTGSIKTGEPDTGYGRAAIKIGARNTGQAFNSAGHLPVNIDGTIYYINVYSSLP
jgi:hypothetical protein